MKYFNLLKSVVSGFILCCAFAAQAHAHREQSTQQLGFELETQFWNLVQKHDVKGFSEKISDAFQADSFLGILNRDQEIAGLSNGGLQTFTLQNMVVTRDHNVLIVSYIFEAISAHLTNGPTISVWKKSGSEWKLVSHSFFPLSG